MASPSAACRRALADATRLCPNRNRANDGIIGDTCQLDDARAAGNCGDVEPGLHIVFEAWAR